jgi:hypothetical protein
MPTGDSDTDVHSTAPVLEAKPLHSLRPGDWIKLDAGNPG